MNRKLLVLPLVAAFLVGCGDGAINVKSGNAVVGAENDLVEVKSAKVLSNAFSTDSKTQLTYNSPILANESGFYAVSSFGLSAEIRSAFTNLKAGDVISFSGKIQGSTGGEFGQAGTKQLIPQGVPQVENKTMNLKFAEPTVTIDLADYNTETSTSANFQAWYDTITDETSLFGMRLLFKNVTLKESYGGPTENGTGQAYFMSDSGIGKNSNGKGVRVSLYHTPLATPIDYSKTYDITTVIYGINKKMSTNDKLIVRCGAGEATTYTAIN